MKSILDVDQNDWVAINLPAFRRALAANGMRDMTPELRVGVGFLIADREWAREQKDWELADHIRDTLAAFVEFRDTKDGTEWRLKTDMDRMEDRVRAESRKRVTEGVD